MSWAQNALLELKLAAIRCLCHQDFLVLLGETEDTQQMWCVSVSVSRFSVDHTLFSINHVLEQCSTSCIRDEIYTTVVQDGEMPAYALVKNNTLQSFN